MLQEILHNLDELTLDKKNCENSSDSATVIEGMFQTCRIIPKRIVALEHGDLKAVRGIIIHQTDGEYVDSTLIRYYRDNALYKISHERFENFMIFKKLAKYSKGTGAHFLISPKGTIFQTARIDKICYHVGYIRARCMETHMCEPNIIQYYNTLHNKERMLGTEDKAVWKDILDSEKKKEWDKRYPTNDDSIGIEVVGRPSKPGEAYPVSTPSQGTSAKWLVKLLLDHFHLKRTNVFAHGTVSPQKEPSEGTRVRY